MHEPKTAYLRQLYDRINRMTFFGDLPEIPIEIDEIRQKHAEPGLLAGYFPRRDDGSGGKIVFDSAYLQTIDTTDQQQRADLAAVMLHEMIHAYCDRYEIDDSDHAEAFALIADVFGLDIECADGYTIRQQIDGDLLESL